MASSWVLRIWEAYNVSFSSVVHQLPGVRDRRSRAFWGLIRTTLSTRLRLTLLLRLLLSSGYGSSITSRLAIGRTAIETPCYTRASQYEITDMEKTTCAYRMGWSRLQLNLLGKAAKNPTVWDRKKDAGRHEPEYVPVSVHTVTTAAYRLLCEGHVRAAHGIHILPDLIPYSGMD